MSTIENPKQCQAVTGLVSDIQRFSIHDGPGIRTTVFLKGCPLNCLWCHNPECISRDPQTAFYSTRCIGCGTCATVCSTGAIVSGNPHVDRSKCQACGTCATECPAEALQLVGREMSAEDVIAVVLRDVPFYKRSGGGMTLSGGEPLMQDDFSVCLLEMARAEGLHTAVETCGVASPETLARAADLTDLWLYDIKVIDPEKHHRLCGADNKLILQNARELALRGADIVYRTPLVPGCNDSPEDLRALGEFILSLPKSPKLELLAYHRIGGGKYEACGMQYQLSEVPGVDDLAPYEEPLLSMGVQLVEH